jgi:hypothetical protein
MVIDMNSLFVYEGIFTVGTTGSSYITTPLLRSDVAESSQNGEVDLNEVDPTTTSGTALIAGNFIGKLKKFGKKSYKFLSKPEIKNLIREPVKTGEVLGVPGASQLDYAIDKAEDISRSVRGKGEGGMLLSSGGNWSNSQYGGQILSSAQMRKRMTKR